jgi:hypothetical protein
MNNGTWTVGEKWGWENGWYIGHGPTKAEHTKSGSGGGHTKREVKQTLGFPSSEKHHHGALLGGSGRNTEKRYGVAFGVAAYLVGWICRLRLTALALALASASTDMDDTNLHGDLILGSFSLAGRDGFEVDEAWVYI